MIERRGEARLRCADLAAFRLPNDDRRRIGARHVAMQRERLIWRDTKLLAFENLDRRPLGCKPCGV